MKVRIENVLASDELPSLPEVAHRVLLLARDRRTSVDRLAAAVKADPAMSAKIIRTANSAFFGRQYKIESVEAAVPVLGATLIRTLVLGFSLSSKETWQFVEEAYRKIWRRALIQAVAAELLAERLPHENSSRYFVAGLIQDVGVLALLCTNPKGYVKDILGQSTILNLAHVEKKQLGFSHVDVSVGFGEKWQLDKSMIEAISDHHGPMDLLSGDSRRTNLGQALKLAAHCAAHLETSSNNYTRAFHVSLSQTFLVKDVDEFIRQVQARANQAAGLFSVDTAKLPPIQEILGSARVAIEDIAIQSQLEAAEAREDALKVRDRLERVEHRSRHFEQEMYKDPLTGAFNRRLMESGLEKEITFCVDEQKSLCLLFLDIDNFKPLNDICGHDCGDRALRAVVSVLKDSLRESDLVIRYGGDEFITVLLGLSIDALESIASRICVEVQRILREITDEVATSVSVGGIHCPPECLVDLDVDTLVREVDQRMYEAKQRGGNQFSISPLMTPEVVGHSPVELEVGS